MKVKFLIKDGFLETEKRFLNIKSMNNIEKKGWDCIYYLKGFNNDTPLFIYSFNSEKKRDYYYNKLKKEMIRLDKEC